MEVTMSKRNLKLSMLFLFLMVVAAAGSLVSPKADAGVWSQVCCGAGCGGMDYCIGSGSYTCCKGTPDY
jgi:hypothetical protein